jgi:CubicO group peptidase (beta-lactamase class C family)
LKPLFVPGARRQYCNGCYIVLGAIIETVSGIPYERYMQENIFKSAGMTATGPLQADGINPRVAIGYTQKAGDSASIFATHIKAGLCDGSTAARNLTYQTRGSDVLSVTFFRVARLITDAIRVITFANNRLA